MSTDTVPFPGIELEGQLDGLDGFGEQYSPPIGHDADDDVSRETSEINEPPAESAPRRRPGPPPNPNSARSRRKAAAAAKATAPRKRTRPNTSTAAPSPAAEPASVHERGALAILGWVARPLALAGLAMGIGAATRPLGPDNQPTRQAVKLDRQAQALGLDSLTLTVHGPALAKGVAPAAESIPWLAGALEKAAQVSPVAALVEAGAGILLQVLANHGLVPVTPMLGTMSPEELRVAAGLELFVVE